jgi:O-antigen/teichoic acid export membrane protein
MDFIMTQPSNNKDNSLRVELKSLIKDSVVYGMGRQINLFLSLILVSVYTRIFSPADYGVLEMLNTTMYLLMPILGFCIEAGSARFYYDYSGKEQQKLIATGFYFKIFICTVAFAILFRMAGLFSMTVFKVPDYFNLYRITFLTTCLSVLLVLATNVMRLAFKSIQYSAINILNILLTSFITIYFIVFRKTGIIGVFWASCISTFLCLFLTIVLLKGFFRPMFSFKMLKEQLLFGLPLVPVSIFYWVLKYSDRYFLMKLSNIREVGLYAIGVRLSGVLVLITFAFQRAWMPFVFSRFSQPNAKFLFSRIFDYYMLVLLSFAAFISIYAKEILKIITQPVYISSHIVVGILCLSLVVMAARSFFEIGINISKKTYLTTLTVTIGVIVNLILNFILISKYGMMGAAASTLVSYTFTSVLTFFIANKYYPIRYDFLKLSKLVFIVLIAIALGIVMEINNLALSIGIKFILFILYIIAIPLLGIIDRSELLYLRASLYKYGWVLWTKVLAKCRLIQN